MTVQEMEAITGGYHGDPFAFLGPHMVDRDGKTSGKFAPFSRKPLSRPCS